MSQSEPMHVLRVTSEDTAVLITILDREFAPVAEGLGEVELPLPAGLYEARFEAGSSVREQLISLAPGEQVRHVHQRRIAFATPAPLPDTLGEVPEQSRTAARVSRKVNRVLGQGGQLMVFARDLDLRGRSNPTHGLGLRGPAQQRVVVAQDGVRGGGPQAACPPWAGCNYELDPGSWMLRSPTPAGGAVEQAVAVCRGWQTQVFLERGRSRVGRTRRPDLANAAVLMAKPGAGFDPERADLRAAELARQGLRDRRFAIAEKELRAMLVGKPRNPMLAIYGAHLLIHRESPDRKLIRKVAHNLRELIGEHPDVRAIELWLGDQACGDFAEPPMLKSSWWIVVDASAQRPELVPRGSFSAAISSAVLAGGPWLRWRTQRTHEQRSSTVAPELPLGEALAEVAAALPDDLRTITEHASEVSPAESSVIAFARQAGGDAAQISDAEVLNSLKVPRTVAEDTVGAVLERLTD
jgi:hypothetical protein